MGFEPKAGTLTCSSRAKHMYLGSSTAVRDGPEAMEALDRTEIAQ